MDDCQHFSNEDGLLSLPSSAVNDGILVELLSMGFGMSAAVAALKTQGVDNLVGAVEFLLAGNSSECQTHAQEHEAVDPSTNSLRGLDTLTAKPVNRKEAPILFSDGTTTGREQSMENKIVVGTVSLENLHARTEDILSKYFGYRKLKPFQMEALEAWANHQDCLVLAATGSGKSLCFQLPALLTGKVAVVISPLISLMHDQCQQLSRHGIAACFLGSGQPDKTVEKKAMAGMYSLVYVCPETLPRLVNSLRELACKQGLALLAIDEAHCISKWGHDFRPEYRRLSTLREVFNAQSLLGLKDTVPIMALTATATKHVQLDIMKSLKMDIDRARIVQTTLFRPNLRFSVRHSKTCKPSSYEDDFKVLFNYYLGSSGKFDHSVQAEKTGNLSFKDSEGKDLTVDFLEDDYEDEMEGSTGDFEVTSNDYTESTNQSLLGQSLSAGAEYSPSIVYLPTRKETESVAKFLCQSGLKAAPYHARLPKAHLRHVHEQFHLGTLQVVVATMAFGMGIDKPDVRHIIHYGWPQSLEAYYQEAGRAGRDGLLSECMLFCDMTVLPSLLPCPRDQQQNQHALHMLEQCFRYGLSTTKCRTDTLLKYFGEDLPTARCETCDVCTRGPPCLEDLTLEAEMLMSLISSRKHLSSQKEQRTNSFGNKQGYQIAVREIEKSEKVPQRTYVWWRGFGRVLADAGFLREEASLVKKATRKLIVPVLRNPEVTAEGQRFLAMRKTDASGSFTVHPQGDMIQALLEPCRLMSQEWGRGWADPEIRKQRLGRAKIFSKWQSRDKRQRRRRANSRGRKRRRLSL